jgi:hypothetical protein
MLPGRIGEKTALHDGEYDRLEQRLVPIVERAVYEDILRKGGRFNIPISAAWRQVALPAHA